MDCVEKFAFNSSLLKELAAVQYAPFRIPCIYGCVQVKALYQDQTVFDVALVSRKDWRRCGLRFVARGLDREGNCANFVETEQILTVYDSQALTVASYVQTRGSIPVMWSQKVNMRYSPLLKINPNFQESIEAAKIHIEEGNRDYGQ